MIKRIPSRTSRSKGIKIKYVLQICLLVGVCFWLIYQVKRSHDKKEEFNEKEVKDSSGVVKLGRKDLHPHVTGLNKNDDPEDEEEEETKMGEELHQEEKMKLEQEQEEAEMMQREKEEEEQEGEAKHEGEELEGAKNEEEEREEELEEETKREELEEGEGDGEIDERDLEKLEGQADHDEEVNEEEEKEKHEESEDKEAESTEGEDKTQLDQENSMEDQNQDAVAKNTHEAREEHYKADDASSAVTHDKPILSAESENVSMGHINKDLATTDSVNVSNFTYNSTEDVNRDHNNLIVQPGQNLATEIVDVVNATSASNERLLANSEDNSHGGPKSSFSDDHSVPNNASTGVSTEAGKDANGESTEMFHPLKHDEAQVMESTQARDAAANSSTTKDLSNLQTTELEQSNNETSSDGRETDSSSNFPDTTENAGTEGRDNSSSSTHVESDVPNTNIKPEVTAEADISSGVSSTTKGAADDTHNETRETSDESGGTDEKPGNSNANGKNENEGMRNLVDTADSAIAKDVKENRIDLVTLPENKSGGVNDGNAEE